jgi:hypothetical protein
MSEELKLTVRYGSIAKKILQQREKLLKTKKRFEKQKKAALKFFRDLPPDAIQLIDQEDKNFWRKVRCWPGDITFGRMVTVLDILINK